MSQSRSFGTIDDTLKSVFGSLLTLTQSPDSLSDGLKDMNLGDFNYLGMYCLEAELVEVPLSSDEERRLVGIR